MVEPSGRFDWSELNKQVDRCVIVVVVVRPGARLFITKLEFTHYPPRTERNNDFWQGVGIWKGMTFAAISIPREDKHLAEEVAASLGMCLAENLALVLFAGEGTAVFPARGKHVFFLEGEFTGEEDKECEAIFAADQPARREWVHQHIHLGRTYPDFLDAWLGNLKQDTTHTPLFVQRAVETRPDTCDVLVCADASNQAYGWITLCRSGDDPNPYVGILYVTEGQRRLGLGTLLVKAAISYVNENDLGKLRFDSRSKILDKILGGLPPEINDYIEVNHLGDDLSGEQEQSGGADA